VRTLSHRILVPARDPRHSSGQYSTPLHSAAVLASPGRGPDHRHASKTPGNCSRSEQPNTTSGLVSFLPTCSISPLPTQSSDSLVVSPIPRPRSERSSPLAVAPPPGQTVACAARGSDVPPLLSVALLGGSNGGEGRERGKRRRLGGGVAGGRAPPRCPFPGFCVLVSSE
jgi:hypothetical protein